MKQRLKNFRDEEVSEEVINSFLYDFQHMEESDITEQKSNRQKMRTSQSSVNTLQCTSP